MNDSGVLLLPEPMFFFLAVKMLSVASTVGIELLYL